MEELSIKIRIYDRQYPMKVHPQEEALVREAAEAINGMLQAYRESYSQIDIQDLLGMVALDTVVAKLQLQRKYHKEQSRLNSDIESLIRLVDVDEG